MFNKRVPYAGYFSAEEFPIISAIYNNDKETLRGFIKQGWNVNSTGEHGMTYLLFAVRTNNYKMTKFLLENGADPNLISNVWDSNPKITEAMFPLKSSCYDRYDIKFMKLLIEYNADVNEDRASLPIFAAALNDDKKKIEYLLEHGADINKFSKSKQTVITNQATVGKWPMVLWLWDKGADPMKTGGIGALTGKQNVAFWLQNRINRNQITDDLLQVKARLESIGVKFPYRPVQQEEQDSVKVNCEEN